MSREQATGLELHMLGESLGHLEMDIFSKLLRDTTRAQTEWREQGYPEEAVQVLTRRHIPWKDVIAKCIKAFEKGDQLEDIFRLADILLIESDTRKDMEEAQKLTDSLLFAQDIAMAVNERRMGRNPKKMPPVDMENARRKTLQTLETPGLGRLLGIPNNGDSLTGDTPPEHAIRIVNACESVPNIQIGEFDSAMEEAAREYAKLKSTHADTLRAEESLRQTSGWKRMVQTTIRAIKTGDELPNILGFIEILMTRSPHRNSFTQEENLRHASLLTQDVCIAISEEEPKERTGMIRGLQNSVRHTLRMLPLGRFLGLKDNE